jgi:adenosylcobinamide-GDP ribazoletransferase
MSTQRRHWAAAPRMAPLLGVAIGAVGGGVYWLGAQVWPASIAVILSMVATELVGARSGPWAGAAAGPSEPRMAQLVFTVLVKYNALMALSAASLPFPLPANLALGLIMIAGQASSRALAMSAIMPAAYADLGIALAIGFAPAVLIGMPGLVGLAAAIAARIAFIAYARRKRAAIAGQTLETTRQLTEVCFYLGAVAAWAFA